MNKLAAFTGAVLLMVGGAGALFAGGNNTAGTALESPKATTDMPAEASEAAKPMVKEPSVAEPKAK